MSEHTSNLSPAEATEADRQAVGEVIEKARIALVTSVHTDGSLVSRPLALQDRDFDGDVYFFIPKSSAVADQVAVNGQVNVAVEHKGSYLSLAGTGSVVQDQALIDQLWNQHAEAWFEQGRQDPEVALLRVHADSAELQSNDSPRIVALAKYAKAIVSNEQPDLGDKTRVEL